MAPDYVLVLREIEEAFIAEITAVYVNPSLQLRVWRHSLGHSYAEFFPGDLAKSEGYSRIVATTHVERIKKLVDETKGKLILGGDIDVEKRYIAPTVVRDVPKDDSLMSE